MDGTMLEYGFSAEKNYWLIKERGISFEDIIAALHDGRLLDVLDHPDKAKYPNQKLYIVNITGYVYVVPFVKQTENCIFLKTIIPNRKLTKLYLGGQHDEKA
jgi:uncharacterized DUF497 family protein